MGRAATKPAAKTKDPTPISMSDVPQFSTFANLRGNILKSTASIAIHVITSIPPRYVVKKDFFGSGLGASSFVSFDGGNFTFFGIGALGAAYMRATGASRRILRRRGVSAYKVVARRIAPTLRRKSTANARGL